MGWRPRSAATRAAATTRPGPGGDRSQPDVGAFGVAVAIAVIGLRLATLASMAPSVLLLAGIWAASRTSMAVIAGVLPYARDHGLASPFGGDPCGRNDAAGSRWRPIAARRRCVRRRCGDRRHRPSSRHAGLDGAERVAAGRHLGRVPHLDGGDRGRAALRA